MANADHQSQDPHLHRLTILCDGVFAIALTLLSLELKPPEGWDGQNLMGIIAPKLVAYAVSFAVIGIYWATHRRCFQNLARADLLLDVFSLVFLALLALLPPTTAVLYQHATIETVITYIGLVTAIGWAQALTWGYACFVGKLVKPEVPMATRVFVLFTNAVLPGGMCGLSFYSLATGSPWGWVGIAVLGTIAGFGHKWLARLTGRRGPQAGKFA